MPLSFTPSPRRPSTTPPPKKKKEEEGRSRRDRQTDRQRKGGWGGVRIRVNDQLFILSVWEGSLDFKDDESVDLLDFCSPTIQTSGFEYESSSTGSPSPPNHPKQLYIEFIFLHVTTIVYTHSTTKQHEYNYVAA